MTQKSLNEQATLSINCEIDIKRDFTTITHKYAEKGQENVSLMHTDK